MINQLSNQRIRSIDAFRGITILVMIFVNDVARVRGIPVWMKHKAADADAMTFVDVVFPAFLFIVGMSLPFAIHHRLAKGNNIWLLWSHILWRTLGLLILGVFMVNAEGGYNEKAMGMSIATWSLLFYLCAILVWNVYKFKNKIWKYLFQSIGAIGLISLAMNYRGGEEGTDRMQPHWWGILGLIGWAYLFSCIIYQLLRGNIILLVVAVAGCVAWYTLSRSHLANSSEVLQWMAARAGHATHTGIVVSGIILSLIFFDERNKTPTRIRFIVAFAVGAAAFIAGYLLRPYFSISKIYATPSWSLYSVGICVLLYSFLYWLIDINKKDRWVWFFQPAASNPLLVYILPAIIMYMQIAFGIYFMPAIFHEGSLGIAWSAVYAILVMWLAMGLNKLNIRLHL